MFTLILATVLASPMPAPAWLTETDPMPPPVVAPTGLIETIREAKALIHQSKRILDAAQRDGKIRLDIHLPEVTPEAAVVEVDESEVELIEPPKPPVLARLPGPRNLFRCPHCGKSDCLMFLGQVLRTRHGVSDEYLEELTYRQRGVLYGNIINSRKPVVAVQSGCPGGICPTPRRRILFPNVRRRFR